MTTIAHKMREGWLKRQLDNAAAEVATWPQWKRDMIRQQFARDPNPQWSCVHRASCREAQTCAGKPCHAKKDH
jgi:hypothetical protein